jgi:hypothetical protein
MSRQRSIARSLAAFAAVVLSFAGVASAQVSFGDFQTGTAPGWGSLTNAGIGPWTAPVTGSVATGSVGSFSGSQVLNITGTPAFNFGQSGGAAVGFDFLSQNLRNDFLANSKLEFDWLAVPQGSTSGFNELFNVILNSQGGGFTNVGGQSQATPNSQQFYFSGYNGNVLHVVVDYTTYKNTILASANPNGGGWLQFGIQPNAGGYSAGITQANFQFDNFKLTGVPEPASIGVLMVGCVGLLRRRR